MERVWGRNGDSTSDTFMASVLLWGTDRGIRERPGSRPQSHSKGARPEGFRRDVYPFQLSPGGAARDVLDRAGWPDLDPEPRKVSAQAETRVLQCHAAPVPRRGGRRARLRSALAAGSRGSGGGAAAGVPGTAGGLASGRVGRTPSLA